MRILFLTFILTVLAEDKILNTIDIEDPIQKDDEPELKYHSEQVIAGKGDGHFVWGHWKEDNQQELSYQSDDIITDNGDVISDISNQWLAKLGISDKPLSVDGKIFINIFTTLMPDSAFLDDDSTAKLMIKVMLDMTDRKIADAQTCAYNLAGVLGVQFTEAGYQVIGDISKRGDLVLKMITDIGESISSNNQLKEEVSLVKYLLQQMTSTCSVAKAVA